jgi:heme oxygenase
MTAIADLRSATWTSHQRLEKRLDVKMRFTESDAYRAHLEKMWGFCAAIERRLGRNAVGGALADYEKRRKVPLLTRDLVALGAPCDSVMQLPCCDDIPDVADPAAAFGCIYVLEGATLGGRTLLPLVQSRLGLTADRGAAFLASYGEDVALMWRGFGAALDAWCDAGERRQRAAWTAVATFTSLEQWLCGNPS